jgi:hypothetical protein
MSSILSTCSAFAAAPVNLLVGAVMLTGRLAMALMRRAGELPGAQRG